MRRYTASLFKNGRNRAVRLPKALDFEGVTDVEIIENGDSLTIRPLRNTPTVATLSKRELLDLLESADDEDRIELMIARQHLADAEDATGDRVLLGLTGEATQQGNLVTLSLSVASGDKTREN